MQNNEIKEILDDLDYAKNKERGTITLNQKDINLLLDYITNLQQENERLKLNHKQLKDIDKMAISNSKLIKENEKYKSIIEKAVEIIDLIKPELWNISNKMTYRLIDIEQVLNGRSNK